MSKKELIEKINKIKKEMNAIILAHYYQVPEIQDIADFIGDSLDLSKKAAETDADVIVFCGVHFMAETAKMLSPSKMVLLPDMDAGCSLAESAPEKEFGDFVRARPEYTVVTYVNSTAVVKALSDYCITSSNALHIVNQLPKDKPIIIAPDRFLGDWIKKESGRDDILLWQGSCEVHELFSEKALVEMKDENPNAIVLVHPECPESIRRHADVLGSTKVLLAAVQNGKEDAEYIVVTEPGIIYKMKEAAPKAKFIAATAFIAGTQDGSCSSCNECPHMKLNTLEKLYDCMNKKTPQIELEPELIEKAKLPIERMLELS